MIVYSLKFIVYGELVELEIEISLGFKFDVGNGIVADRFIVALYATGATLQRDDESPDHASLFHEELT